MKRTESYDKRMKQMRYTEYHTGVAVIKDKTLLKEAMAKLAKLEDAEEQGRLNVYPEGFPLSPVLEEKYTKGEKKNDKRNPF